ncbi:flagellar biosynthesis protein FliQ [Rhodovastum atsumiense]|uniref:Flagellar biosynthetic protein FliQ n=1 Tax=Rhodovastum atsumiense TaxID=504468 RepID=A0A5M6ISA6_9PROT|nr:flagellar biosynthesis protein FliQ [Rhodovastum atsumiense]KAA5611112.1 flagellar biosynthesis protein FliQ [Rhodovastum atsumiense]CAH2599177.1 flagellar biosynthesis protein FliQ [Rhodovastum atsumiense]
MQDGDLGLLLRDALLLILKLGGPPLAATLVVGLAVSLLQAVTQINEATLSFVPKALAIVATLLLTGGWMLGQLADFTRLLFDRLVASGG